MRYTPRIGAGPLPLLTRGEALSTAVARPGPHRVSPPGCISPHRGIVLIHASVAKVAAPPDEEVGT